jgi:hypothetical protein
VIELIISFFLCFHLSNLRNNLEVHNSYIIISYKFVVLLFFDKTIDCRESLINKLKSIRGIEIQNSVLFEEIK